MQMQKGICLELNNDRSIFILNDGRFVEGRPAEGAAVGEEAYFFPKAKKARAWSGFFGVPAVLAAAILMLVLSVALPSEKAYAYVQIEVNPSIELGIDEEFRVVSVRELNEDGVKVISKLADWENQSLDEVLEKAILLSLKESTEKVTITTVMADSKKEDSTNLESAVRAVSAKIATEEMEVHLKEASSEQWRKSVKENVPVGQKVEDFKVIEEPLKEKDESGANKPAPKESTQKEKRQDSKRNLEKTTPAAVPVQEKKPVIPPTEKKKAAPPVQEKKNTPPGQEKKANPPGQEKKNTPPAQAEKAVPPLKEKKSANPGQHKKAPPGQEKKKTVPPGQDKKTPPGQEKKSKNTDSKKNENPKPGQEKKNDPGNKNNGNKGGNGKE